MNSLSKLSFLVMALALGACNEKVSPELQGAATTSTTGGSSSGGTPVTPEQYYFRVVDTTDTMLNFKVHKTGAGNANTNCEIKSSTALSSNGFRSDPATYDISCFYEAEELSLRYNGFKFAVEASPNTCEYVAYGPFGYFDRIPGSSTQTLYEITCPEENTPGQADIDSVVSANHDGIPCGGMRNAIVTPGGSFDKPESDTSLCAYDYTAQEGPNCDIGVITINSVNVTMADNDGDGTFTPAAIKSTRTVNCGGQVSACLDGPFTIEGFDSDSTSGIKVQPSTLNTAYTKEYTYPGLLGVYNSNRKYVNYRRDLASLNIEYGNSDRSSGTLTNSYMSSFGDPDHKYDYNPELMAMYSDNKRMNGATLVSTANQTFAATLNGFTSHVPYAAEPFIGLNGYKTNAFYTMYCFDNAYDVKARIRMVVRDWDRVQSSSPTDTSFARISDVDLLPPLARQDVPYTDEVTGEPDSWNAFNDAGDWDDFIDMEREDGGTTYTPGITIWRTYPQIPYTQADTNGFINPQYFPAAK
jgi:hypothetical protein